MEDHIKAIRVMAKKKGVSVTVATQKRPRMKRRHPRYDEHLEEIPLLEQGEDLDKIYVKFAVNDADDIADITSGRIGVED
jgi:hypothetical protein